MPLPRLALAPHPGALAVIVLAFLLPGLASHDPWKTHDVIGLAIVHGMAGGSDGLVPRVAGMLWLYDGPLYHWVALGFGRLLGGLLEFHSAARLASGAFMLAAFWLLYAAARDWSTEADRRTTAAAAVLLLLGSVGLMVHSHEALPEIAALAGLCGALAALPHVQARPLRSGAGFGAGLGIAALSATWMAPAALGLAAAAAVPRPAARALALLMLLAALVGAGLAGWHVWLQMNPESLSCGPGLETMLENFPLTQVLPRVFRGSGDCADAGWVLFGLSIAGWSLVWFTLLTIACITTFFRPLVRK